VKLILFDIDGTLILSGEVDVRATNAAFERVFRVRDAFTGLKTDGRTVTWVVEAALARTNTAAAADAHAAFKREYLERLAYEVAHAPDTEMKLLPGADTVIPRLSARGDVRLGLVTGNFPEAARIKLERFGLWSWFAFGGFGDDGRERGDLVPAALARARERGWLGGGQDVIVVGDTPHDVRAALPHGVRVLAIPTGPYSADDLRAAGATTIIERLDEIEALLDR
jgi:phosphoglycolate phosphatase-like HAD superfamily hydrolase